MITATCAYCGGIPIHTVTTCPRVKSVEYSDAHPGQIKRIEFFEAHPQIGGLQTGAVRVDINE